MTRHEERSRDGNTAAVSGANVWYSILDTSGNRFRLIVVLALITIGMALASPGKFLSFSNITSMCYQFPELGIFALAITVTLITGGIDLSVISIANLSGILAALVLTQAIPDGASGPLVIMWGVAAVLTAIGTGLLCGAVNGLLVARVGITPILATLGSMQLFAGLSYVITKGPAIHGFPNAFLFVGNGSIGPIPIPLFVFSAAAIAMAVLLNKTVLGVNLSLVGTNDTAARYAGINVRNVLTKTYVISGVLSAVAGVLMIARTNSAKADFGSSYLLLAVLVAVLGGVDPKGGFGTVSGVCLSVLSLQFLSSGFSMLRFSNFAKEFAWGVLLLLVMATNHLCHQVAARQSTKPNSQTNTS